MIGRNDLFLLLGLAVALFAITSRPIGRALVYAQEIERSMGLQLLPGSSSSPASSSSTLSGSATRLAKKR